MQLLNAQTDSSTKGRNPPGIYFPLILKGTARTRRITGATLALALLLIWACGLRLALALPQLDKDRFWDERYGVENLRSLLVDGQLRPANGFHPGLSYLPHAALLAASEGLHRRTGRAVFAVFAGDDDLSPTGYFLCRMLQALAATLSLYLIYRIGRRLDSPATGVTAALLLAVVPWHLRQSVIFKPDILLVTASLVAFAASLAAAEHPSRRRIALAGAAVGLALAAKFSAGPAAIPVAIAALAGGGWRCLRRWGALLLAGLAAAAVCLLFTPFLLLDPGLYAWSLGTTLRDYAAKGSKQGSSHLMVLAHAPSALLSEGFHGPVIGALGLAGLLLAPVASTALADSPAGSRARQLGPLMMSAYVAGYALAYALSTTNLSDHNWLPVAPFVALAAAWVVHRGWASIAPRLRAWQRLALGAAAVAAAATYLVAPANSYVYETCVPPVQERARDYLRDRLQPLGWRVVVREEDPDAQWYGDPAIVQEVPSLDEMLPEELDRADAEIFHADRLDGVRGGFYRRRLEARGAVVARFEPGLFRARGRSVVVVVHRWIDQGEPEALDLSPLAQAPERLGAELPATQPAGLAAVASMEVWLPPGTDPEVLRNVLIGGSPLAPVFVGREAGSPRFVTERFLVPAARSRVTLVLARFFSPDSGVGIQLQRWRLPRVDGPSPAARGAPRCHARAPSRLSLSTTERMDAPERRDRDDSQAELVGAGGGARGAGGGGMGRGRQGRWERHGRPAFVLLPSLLRPRVPEVGRG